MTSSRHTVGRWLLDSADRRPAHPAIDDRGVVLTYKEVAARARDLAARLAGAGYGAGDRIATVSGTSADHVVAFFACALTGLTFAPLSVRLAPAELGALLTRTDPALILVDEEHERLLASALEAEPQRCPRASLGTAGVESHAPGSARPTPARAAADSDPLLLIFTSGAEAAPKGVLLSHEACFWTNLALDQAMPLREDDVVLCVLPQYHVAAWNVQPLLAWRTGATVVLERGFSPSRVLSLLETRGVTAMMGVPTQYRLLLDDPAWDQTDLATLRLAVSGGARLSPEVAQAWRERGTPLTPGYGLTEAGPNTLHLPAAQAADAPEAVGVPYPHVEVSLRDPESGLVLEGAAAGELWVRSPSLFSGYLDDPAATAQVLTDGWLRSGDLASRDESGRYSIVDRIKDIYISGGENVAPAEVERVLESHPLVARAAVVGVPDDVWGERGAAFVRPVAGAVLTRDEMEAHARSLLAGFKVPVQFTIVEDLPTGTLDKVERRHLRERAVAERRTR
ncbi:class I adenylate-forming enzyme family protein [Demequina zhanjiangensis]|uniref:Class I adenylate-forming enzyme family protein n=1 Tax=Demequina zhanjiangensis TaxID=3051659 RepID=A0ABT8G296_9MICO|nr:class I adenylate-forming enzyme family protein [Demequina sp. SYSU T00b26]MDN4473266.1 class I adenylate-forming enzyme family protein [Demequina sp. SYSU T00b26]